MITTAELTVGDAVIAYTLRQRPGLRRLRLAVYGDGELVVSAPKRVSKKFIEAFIRDKADWILDKTTHAKQAPSLLNAKHTPGQIARYKTQAFILAKQRLEYFNQHYHLPINGITIRNQRTRWGSCSKRGQLNFTYKIALLPPELADYIIVHELCHLGEFNHSAAFWKLVAQTIPNHRALRAKLKHL